MSQSKSNVSPISQLHGRSEPNVGPTLADPPRQMTKEQRRRVFSKIDEVYLNEKSGYSAGWNDDRIARELNVPRAWIATIRDDNFGPGISEQVDAALSEAKALLHEFGRMDKALIALGNRHARLQSRAEDVAKSLRRIEAAGR